MHALVQSKKSLTFESGQNSDYRVDGSCQTINSSNQSQIKRKNQIVLCPEHPETELSLFNINTLTHQCPKCVVYSCYTDKFKDAIFVQIDSKTHNVDVVMEQKLNALQLRLNKIRQTVVNSVRDQRQKTQKNVYGKLGDKYRQFLEELNKHKKTQEQKIRQKIQKVWDNLWKQSMDQFSKFQQNINKIKKSISKNSDSNSTKQKQSSIAKAMKMLSNMDILNKNLQLQSELVVNSYKKYSNEYKCGLKMESNNKYPLLLTKRSSTLEKKQLFQKQLDSEQLLISGIDSFEYNMEKIQEEFPTQNSLNFSVSFSQNDKSVLGMATQRSNISTIQKSVVNKTISRPSLNTTTVLSNSKTLLTLSSLNSLNKIQSQIREVDARNLQLTNMDGKKVINLISKSFVKSLDLSNNRLNSMFLKDLNKAQIGKYLKTIKLSGNHLDIKDSAIAKKIDQLKIQGVNIIL